MPTKHVAGYGNYCSVHDISYNSSSCWRCDSDRNHRQLFDQLDKKKKDEMLVVNEPQLPPVRIVKDGEMPDKKSLVRLENPSDVFNSLQHDPPIIPKHKTWDHTSTPSSWKDTTLPCAHCGDPGHHTWACDKTPQEKDEMSIKDALHNRFVKKERHYTEQEIEALERQVEILREANKDMTSKLATIIECNEDIKKQLDEITKDRDKYKDIAKGHRLFGLEFPED